MGFMSLAVPYYDVLYGGTAFYRNHFWFIHSRPAALAHDQTRFREHMLDFYCRLSYVEATIREIQRVADITPLGLPHCAAEDTCFMGYLIPKGSWIVSNLNACHRDPKHWPDPERFDPTRFLDDSGHLLRNTPSLLPFSTVKNISNPPPPP